MKKKKTLQFELFHSGWFLFCLIFLVVFGRNCFLFCLLKSMKWRKEPLRRFLLSSAGKRRPVINHTYTHLNSQQECLNVAAQRIFTIIWLFSKPVGWYQSVLLDLILITDVKTVLSRRFNPLPARWPLQEPRRQRAAPVTADLWPCSAAGGDGTEKAHIYIEATLPQRCAAEIGSMGAAAAPPAAGQTGQSAAARTSRKYK